MPRAPSGPVIPCSASRVTWPGAKPERSVEEAPTEAGPLHQLARTHAMAYSWRLGETAQVSVSTSQGLNGPHFGTSSWAYLLPYRADRRASPGSVTDRAQSRRAGSSESLGPPSTDTEASAHLERAIALYRQARELSSSDRGRDYALDVIELGLAWCLAEKGEHAEAAELLRPLVRRTSSKDLDRGSAGPGPLLSAEAVRDLMKLLSSGEVAAAPSEVEELARLREHLAALPRAITPLAVS